MSSPKKPAERSRARYGIDAPYVPALLGLAAVVCIVVGFRFEMVIPLVLGLIFAAEALIYLHTTFRGKFATWPRVLVFGSVAGCEGCDGHEELTFSTNVTVGF